MLGFTVHKSQATVNSSYNALGLVNHQQHHCSPVKGSISCPPTTLCLQFC
ncbi:hypothetical protein RchiOBHm_Chr5g0004851 [Rosa chinensis]|uniref:Uncharacterized protein n=1 Tax=Rosa chinensis TaxID=74649 RepID=A0A2P6Q350_ROSCH|nr:hypothetical protein RchiOBHm_Chr5g0004851 [Rosa chinensis]